MDAYSQAIPADVFSLLDMRDLVAMHRACRKLRRAAGDELAKRRTLLQRAVALADIMRRETESARMFAKPPFGPGRPIKGVLMLLEASRIGQMRTCRFVPKDPKPPPRAGIMIGPKGAKGARGSGGGSAWLVQAAPAWTFHHEHVYALFRLLGYESSVDLEMGWRVSDAFMQQSVSIDTVLWRVKSLFCVEDDYSVMVNQWKALCAAREAAPYHVTPKLLDYLLKTSSSTPVWDWTGNHPDMPVIEKSGVAGAGRFMVIGRRR